MKKSNLLKLLKLDYVLGDINADSVIESLAKYPYIWAFVACIFSNAFFLGAIENVPPNYTYLATFLLLGVFMFVLNKAYKSKLLNAIQSVIIGAVFIVLVLWLCRLYFLAKYKVVWHFIGGVVIVGILCLILACTKYKDRAKYLFIIASGFILKLTFIVGSSCYSFQHDVGSFDKEPFTCHAGYIEFILKNHKLPDTDVSKIWQFAHPPLHHIISSIWVGINEFIFNVGHNPARESLQTLSLFYSMCIMITAFKIFKFFKLKGKAFYIPFIIICFHPAFVIFSGSINNDMLSITLSVLTFYFALQWNKERTKKNIIKMALALGLACSAKLSAVTIAPALAVLFLMVLIKEFKKNGKELIIQYLIFGFISIPLGIWYQIRSFVKWHVPLNYVSKMDPNALQYLGKQKFSSRITDFSPKQLSSVYEQWLVQNPDGTTSGYNEYNPIITLLKNSVFEEYINEKNFGNYDIFNTISFVLFWSAALLALLGVIAMIMLFIKGKKVSLYERLLIVVYYLSMMINLYKLAYDHPYTCSMHFRYIAPTCILGALSIGIILKAFGVGEETLVTAKTAKASKASTPAKPKHAEEAEETEETKNTKSTEDSKETKSSKETTEDSESAKTNTTSEDDEEGVSLQELLPDALFFLTIIFAVSSTIIYVAVSCKLGG